MNKPVAWMQAWQNQDGELKKTVNIEQIGKQDIPLYIHPVKELTLTDEKILEVANNKGWRGDLRFLIEFAKAILREASEK